MRISRTIFIASILIVFISATNEDRNNLTDAQKTEARTVVSRFCNQIEYFCNASEQDQTALVNMFSGKFTDQVLNDISDNKPYIGIGQYLLEVAAKNIKISFKENINQVEVFGYSAPNLGNNKNVEDLYAQLIVTKEISAPSFKKEIKNSIVIIVAERKILGILDANTINVPIDPIELWFKAMQLYKQKKYNEALLKFEESGKKGYIPSYYFAGCMYLNKEGCDKLSKKDRDIKGVKYLKFAVHYGYAKAGQDLDRLGIYDW